MDKHIVGDAGFSSRAAALQVALGKFKPKPTLKDSVAMQIEAREFWKNNVTDYESCLKYYEKYHPEYPEQLQVATAQYMTKLATY